MSHTQPTPIPSDNPLTDHEYDGIREFDNPIPGWWSWLFVGTVIFSVFYYGAYQLGTAGTSVQQAFENEKLEVNQRLMSEFANVAVDEPTILSLLNNEVMQSVGSGIYATNCVSCHGLNGEGLVGPNLTDDAFKNVKTLGGIGEVLMNGANAGAMPAWNNRLSTIEIVAVSVHVANLRGQNLPGPRGEEGEVIPPWPEPPTQPAVETTP